MRRRVASDMPIMVIAKTTVAVLSMYRAESHEMGDGFKWLSVYVELVDSGYW